MTIIWTRRLRRDLAHAPLARRDRAARAITLLQKHGPSYPGLGWRWLGSINGAFELRLDRRFRLLGCKQGDTYQLLGIATHDLTTTTVATRSQRWLAGVE